MARRKFKIVVQGERNTFVAACEDLDIASQGATPDEAVTNVREALSSFFDAASPEEVKQRLKRQPAREVSGREVIRVLRDAGFVEVSRPGKHVVMQRRLGDGTVTVPVPDQQELEPATLLSIVRRVWYP